MITKRSFKIKDVEIFFPDDMPIQEAILTAEENIDKYKMQNKDLISIDMKIVGDEVEMTCECKSQIIRLARISGYLAPVDAFNAAKLAELRDRVAHS